jgi:hypothetical protein
MREHYGAERERRPYGTPELFWVALTPTLKRGANNHCAYGASRRVGAYAVARCDSWLPSRTLTTFETPGSCMVTP